MAFADMFRNYEADRVRRVTTGPFARFQTLFEKYEEPPMEDQNNVDVSNEMTQRQSTSSTDTTFNDSMSQAIQEYNRPSGQMNATVRAALAASPNIRVRRR